MIHKLRYELNAEAGLLDSPVAWTETTTATDGALRMVRTEGSSGSEKNPALVVVPMAFLEDFSSACRVLNAKKKYHILWHAAGIPMPTLKPTIGRYTTWTKVPSHPFR